MLCAARRARHPHPTPPAHVIPTPQARSNPNPNPKPEQVEPPSAASVELEARVIRGLILGKGGSQPSERFKIGSPEYAAACTR